MKVITIGRSTQNDVVINDPYVGRNHLQIIQKDDGAFYVVDFGSKNGTYVNGRKVRGEVLLSPNDVVRIGNTTLPWKDYFYTMGSNNFIKSIRFGRSHGYNDVVINDRKVSRIHCRIDQFSDGRFRIVDLGSKNGTYVNGSMIHGETALSRTDIVRVGDSLLSWKEYFSSTGLPTDIDNGSDDGNGAGSIDNNDGKERNNSYGLIVFFLGLTALGIDIYLVIKFFTSFANQLALAFGGVGSSIKLFPIYLRGYFGFNGQWGYMIAALVLGAIADFVGEVIDENDNDNDKLTSAGLALANIAITVSIIFLLLAAFAYKIAENLF